LSICGSESEDVLAEVVVVPGDGAEEAAPLPLLLLNQLTLEHVGGGEGEGLVPLVGEQVGLHGCSC